MEPEKTQDQDFGTPRFARVTSVLLPIVAACSVSLSIVLHWRAYDLISKFLGLVLLFNLGIGLWAIFTQAGKDEKQRLAFMAQIAYTSLLLATILFNRQA
jgi:hypothetical protein